MVKKKNVDKVHKVGGDLFIRERSIRGKLERVAITNFDDATIHLSLERYYPNEGDFKGDSKELDKLIDVLTDIRTKYFGEGR